MNPVSLVGSPAGARWDRAAPSALRALATTAVALVVLDVAVLPILLQEQGTDWVSYQQAGRALVDHQSLYPWAQASDIRAPFPYPYLYPPPLAAIWAAGMTSTIWTVLKVLSLGAVAAFAGSSAAVAGQPRSWGTVAVVAAALVALTLAWPPVLHDLLLGNVMVFYLAGLSVLFAIPHRRWAAIPLGVLLAFALKPLIAPVLVWLLLRRPGQLGVVLGTAAGVTLAFLVLLGPAVYVDYVAALPKLAGLAQPFSGNVGLSSISLPLALAAIPIALAWAGWAARALDRSTGAAVAVAVTLLAQPSLGLNYTVVLVPAVLLLWGVSRAAGLTAAAVAPMLAVISPPLAGIVVAAAATIVGWRRRTTEIAS